MMFTRAAMSTARAVRLSAMMGLQRLDCAPGEMPPTSEYCLMRPQGEGGERRQPRRSEHCLSTSAMANLLATVSPPKDWIELEERRRTLWGIFCLDSHCSISTGWPTFVDPSEVSQAGSGFTVFANADDTGDYSSSMLRSSLS